MSRRRRLSIAVALFASGFDGERFIGFIDWQPR
jgi:hypothetical protein